MIPAMNGFLWFILALFVLNVVVFLYYKPVATLLFCIALILLAILFKETLIAIFVLGAAAA